MKRDFLKGLELSDELIDKIMEAHGKSVERYKSGETQIQTLNQQLEDLKGQLGEANKQIKEFRDMDIDGIRKAAVDWEAKAKQAEKDSEAKIQKMQFDHALEKALAGAKAKNTKAVQALLNMDELKLDNGVIVGLDKQLDGIKKDNDFLFDADDSKPSFTTKTKQNAPGADDAFMAALKMGARLNKE